MQHLLVAAWAELGGLGWLTPSSSLDLRIATGLSAPCIHCMMAEGASPATAVVCVYRVCCLFFMLCVFYLRYPVRNAFARSTYLLTYLLRSAEPLPMFRCPGLPGFP